MKKNTRLTLEDFKLKKSDCQNEIDKLIGGVAATCHVHNGDPTDNEYIAGTSFLVVHADSDTGTFTPASQP